MKGENYVRRILEQVSNKTDAAAKDDMEFMGSVLEVIGGLPSPQKEELFVGLVLLRDQRSHSSRREKAAA